MAMCCCPVVHTSWNPNSSCRNSMPILCLGTGRWFVFVDAPGNLICRQTVCAALVAKSARTLEERRSGGLKEFSRPERQTVPHALRCSRTIRGSVPDLQLISQQQNCEESLSNSCLLCSLDYTSAQHGRCHGNSVFLFSRSLVSKGKSLNTSHHILADPNWAPRLVFVEDVASSWCEAHHLGYGQPLSFEARCWHFNFGRVRGAARNKLKTMKSVKNS